MYIDLNADVGEGFGPYQIGDDHTLLPLLSSANVACGFHAGDPVIMKETVRMIRDLNIDLGAHVGFPDRLGFGRRKILADHEELADYVVYQLGALDAFARLLGKPMTHMSFHGALGNMAAEDAQLSQVLLKAVHGFSADIAISVSTGTCIETAANALGMQVFTSFLADRAYEDDGSLVSRSKQGAVIHDVNDVISRVEMLLSSGCIDSINGKKLPMTVNSILLHGDSPGALGMAQALRQHLIASNVEIMPLSKQR
ncbi:LamB/YcsF family protein [Halomonas sp.]|uniref:LamB/YcsF family protein n=1 Tax=Halomonas sp. TaxID=1486246 RepID=UPI003A94AACC